MAEETGSRRGMVIGALAALVLAACIAVLRQRGVPDLVVQSDEGWVGEMRVAIAGEVVAPGTYTVRGDARLADVIAAAGGYTDAAARDVLNPAARVSDGQAYTIPLQPTPAPRAATATARATTTAATVTTPTRPADHRQTTMPSVLPPTGTEGVGGLPPPDVTFTGDTGGATASVNLDALTDIATTVIPDVEALIDDSVTIGTPEASGTPHARGPRAPRAPRLPAAPRPAPAVHATSTPRPTSTPHPTPTPHPPRATAAKSTAAAKTASTPAVRMAPAASVAPVKKARINAASREELATVPHLSADLARRITGNRAAHGPYRRLDDLTRLPGISRRTVEELRNSLTTE